MEHKVRRPLCPVCAHPLEKVIGVLPREDYFEINSDTGVATHQGFEDGVTRFLCPHCHAEIDPPLPEGTIDWGTW